MATVKDITKGFHKIKRVQSVWRSEYKLLVEGSLLRFIIQDVPGKPAREFFLSSSGLDYVNKEFTNDPALEMVNVPISMFVTKDKPLPKVVLAVEEPIAEGVPTPNYISHQEFDEIAEAYIERIRTTLIEKGREYADKSMTPDRLHNFKRGASISGMSVTRVLFGYWLKHITSIVDIIDNLDKGVVPSDELLKEKLGDNMNYSILLAAAVEELRRKA